jgi:hypothetical protein
MGVPGSSRWIWYRSTYSVPSRRRLWSISVMIALRDNPFPLGPGRIGWRTLVAITTSSRSAKSRRAFPRISSLEPSEYMFAVSNKLMPASSACLISGRLSSSPSDHTGCPRPGSPYVIAPIAIGETSSPVVPSLM